MPCFDKLILVKKIIAIKHNKDIIFPLKIGTVRKTGERLITEAIINKMDTKFN